VNRQKSYGPDKKILFKKTLFDLEVKGQDPTKVIMVRDTPPYGHAPTYQIICLIYFTNRQKKSHFFIVNYVSPSNEGRHIDLV
jgi:hypothetical protein